MVLERDEVATKGRGFQECRLQYQNVVRVDAREACMCWSRPVPPQNPHAKTYFIKRPHCFILHRQFPLADLFARSAHVKTDKRCFFLHHRALCNTHTDLRGRQTDCFGLTAGPND